MVKVASGAASAVSRRLEKECCWCFLVEDARWLYHSRFSYTSVALRLTLHPSLTHATHGGLTPAGRREPGRSGCGRLHRTKA